MMYPRLRKTNTKCSFSYEEPSIESLDLSHSLGITIKARKLERDHCREGRKTLREGFVVDFNANWPQIRSLDTEPHLKKGPHYIGWW